jgi:hypothetical protein
VGKKDETILMGGGSLLNFSHSLFSVTLKPFNKQFKDFAIQMFLFFPV